MLLVSIASAAQQGTAARPKPQPKAQPKAPAAAAQPKAPAAATQPTPATAPAAAGAPTKETVEAFLKRMFGYEENIAFRVAELRPAADTGLTEALVVVNTPQGQQGMRFFITPDGRHAIAGDLMPFGTDPFATSRELLKKEAFGPTKGAKDSPLLLVEFADLQCPACKQAQPNLSKLQADFPQARFVFQNFPLENMHPWASRAAAYVDCLQRESNDAAWAFMESVFNQQSQITDANLAERLDGAVKAAGADPAKISACAQSPDTKARVQRSIELARQLNVSATPTLFVNGRPVGNLAGPDYDALKSIVQFELEQATKGAGAGSKN